MPSHPDRVRRAYDTVRGEVTVREQTDPMNNTYQVVWSVPTLLLLLPATRWEAREQIRRLRRRLIETLERM